MTPLVLKPLPKITRQILENISYAAKIWESYSKSLLWYTPLMNYKKNIYFIVECVYYKNVGIKICREYWTKKESGSLRGSSISYLYFLGRMLCQLIISQREVLMCNAIYEVHV